MCEVEKLMAKYERKRQKALVNFYSELGRLQVECTHKKTHWIQEILKDGSFKEELYKRCFVCGATVETLSMSDDVNEELMNKFDSEVELKKQSLKVDEKSPP